MSGCRGTCSGWHGERPAAPRPQGVHLIQTPPPPPTCSTPATRRCCLLYRLFQHTRRPTPSSDARADLGGDDGPGHPAAGRAADQAAGRARAPVDRRAELLLPAPPGDPHKRPPGHLGERLLELARCAAYRGGAGGLAGRRGWLRGALLPHAPPGAAALARSPRAAPPRLRPDIRPLFTERDRLPGRSTSGRSRRARTPMPLDQVAPSGRPWSPSRSSCSPVGAGRQPN